MILPKTAKNESEDNIFNISADDEEEQKNNIINTSIINTSPKKIGGKKDPAKNIYPGERPKKQEFYEDPADLQDPIEFLGGNPDLSRAFDEPWDLKARTGRKKNTGWRMKRTKKKKHAGNDLAAVNITIRFPLISETTRTVPPTTKPRSSRCFFISGLPPTLRMMFSSPTSASKSGIIVCSPSFVSLLYKLMLEKTNALSLLLLTIFVKS